MTEKMILPSPHADYPKFKIGDYVKWDQFHRPVRVKDFTWDYRDVCWRYITTDCGYWCIRENELTLYIPLWERVRQFFKKGLSK